jgi:coenzyme F420-0:L-glutamate ligase / coenzyme F420-1:gamma-L-glutamate ligase
MTIGALSVLPVAGLPEISQGAVLGDLICDAVALEHHDVVVVTQKIVSKAEGRIVEVDPDDPTAKLRLAEQESVRILRRRGDLIVSETRHGFVCANAGVDVSNVASGQVCLLPLDSDRSARRVRDAIHARTGLEVGVIITDTFGRAWRRGLVDVAIGCAGIAAIVDLRGETDALGRELVATEVCVADEVAAAAELVMGKASGVPVAIVRGLDDSVFRESNLREEVVRPYDEDLFR